MTAPHHVLVLQGGGALGSYQAGAFEALAANNIAIDWVVGTSIGAINGVIIAGNRPEHRVANLRKFWDTVSQDTPNLFANFMPAQLWQPWADAGKVWSTISRGIPGFFKPRTNSIWNINQSGSEAQTSFYDTSPLEATLNTLVDFKYLNEQHVRFTVSAVNVETGVLKTFDNTHQKITARHILASGALPPGFPPIEIDGALYWDGGIYSNTPIDIVLDDAQRRDTLCFMIDLWDPTETRPGSISDALARQKDIQFASRSSEHLEDHARMQNLRRAIRLLSENLTTKQRALPAIKKLAALGCASTVNIVRLIMKALPTDDQNKDIDFARASLLARWQAGVHDVGRALAHKSWLSAPPNHIGMVIHELQQE